MKNLREFYLDLPTGVGLSCAERGDRNGTPLLLLHGYSDSWRSYRLLMAELPNSVRAIAITARGHGDSSKPATGFGSSDFADDIAAVMDKLSIQKAYVAGHSMGSLIGSAFALEHAERLEGLILLGPFAAFEGHPGAEDMWVNVIAPMGDQPDPEFVREFQESTLHKPVPDDFLAAVIAESMKVPGHVWRGALGTLMAENRSADLHKIEAPVLIIGGDKDIFSDAAEVARLTAAMPKAAIIIHKETGHNPHWENPARTAGEILSFVSAQQHAVA